MRREVRDVFLIRWLSRSVTGKQTKRHAEERLNRQFTLKKSKCLLQMSI